MKLERLEVTGFGGLRDACIQFGSRITVLGGDNEAGKTTVHRAIRAALYGIDAGGQGRAVERSEWARWMPWTPGPYGVALTYSLDDGRRIRVARRLDVREQPVQVLEVGGPDLTDELRSGRAVTPGRFHLGIDEAVFCATAWLDDMGLLLESTSAPGHAVVPLQEAIERLADTRRGVTAAQALKRLHDAVQRVGTERRSGSPMGAAALRVRELSARLESARRQRDAVSAEQERLLRLEETEADALERRREAERGWLQARLADVEARLEQLHSARREVAALQASIRQTEALATFPTSLEAPVTSLGGELAQASLSAAEAGERWQAAREPLRVIRRRSAEVAAGLRAIEASPAIEPGAVEAAARLEGELAALRAADAARHSDGASEARIAALRREIAATGLSGVPPAAAGPIGDLLEAHRSAGPISAWYAAATVVAAAGATGAAVMLAAHRGLLALAAAAPALLALLGLLAAGLLQRRRAEQADRHLRRIARSLDVADEDVLRLGANLPVFEALHRALLLEQARAGSESAEADALHASAAALVGRCAALAGESPGTTGAAAATTEALLSEADEMLARFRAAAALFQRRFELERELQQLGDREAALLALEGEAQARRAALDALHTRLQQLLVRAGVSPRPSAAESVAAVRSACDGARQHRMAVTALEELQRRTGLIGAEEDLRAQRAHLRIELDRRGGADPAVAAQPLAASGLQALEHSAEHARQAAAVAGEQARELRTRLATLLASQPDIADLEDERDAAASELTLALHRRDALHRAIELLQGAARSSHRDLAPRLAEAVATRLAMVTADRYAAVNVDTEHFAVSLLVRDRPDMVPLELASHGTRDQVSLLLRLALCEALSTSGETVPVLLDEPLVTADPQRRDAMLAFLGELSAGHQVVMTAADPSLIEALRRTCADAVTVVAVGEQAPLELTGRRARRVRVLPSAR